MSSRDLPMRSWRWPSSWLKEWSSRMASSRVMAQERNRSGARIQRAQAPRRGHSFPGGLGVQRHAGEREFDAALVEDPLEAPEILPSYGPLLQGLHLDAAAQVDA